MRFIFSLFLKKAVEAAKIEKTKGQLTCQESPEVSGDAKVRDGKEHKEKPDCQTDYIHDENVPSHSQSLKNTGECGVKIEEWTDKA